MKVDVVMPTKNSVKPCLKKCLDSIYSEVPVNRLIVVDGGSTDGTVDLVSRYPNVEVVYDLEGNRATARSLGLNLAKTEWIATIDSDVILCKDWFKRARKYMTGNVGLIWGWDIVIDKHSRNRMKVMYYLRRKSEYQLMKRNFRIRGGTHDTLLKREAIEGLKIPRELHDFDDWYVKRYVENRGYKALAPHDVYCYHMFQPNYTIHSCRRIAKYGVKYGIYSRRTVVRNFLLAIPKSLAILLTSFDVKASVDQLKLYTFMFIEVVSP